MNSIKQFYALILTVVNCWLIAATPGDILTQLGIEPAKLQQDILTNLKEPTWFSFSPTTSMRQMARQLPQTSRMAAVRSLGKAVRAYVESPTFRQAWLQELRSDYPYDEAYTEEGLAKQKQTHEAGQLVMQSQLSAQLAAINQTFAQLEPGMLKMAVQTQITQEEEELASMTGNERVTHAQHVATLKRIMTLPPAEFKKQYLASLKQQLQAKINESGTAPGIDKERLAKERQQKKEFDAHADFRPLLKKRLQDFISLSESVDFEARLIPVGRKQTFANPVYEHKGTEWKFLYRLGKEPVTEARLFAKQWLAELP